MSHTSRTVLVRELVLRTVSELGVSNLEDWRETVLIDGGFYVGRCFAFDAVRAVWKETEDRVDFYNDDGESLMTLPLEFSAEQKKAA
jgi:hypothetical protein